MVWQCPFFAHKQEPRPWSCHQIHRVLLHPHKVLLKSTVLCSGARVHLCWSESRTEIQVSRENKKHSNLHSSKLHELFGLSLRNMNLALPLDLPAVPDIFQMILPHTLRKKKKKRDIIDLISCISLLNLLETFRVRICTLYLKRLEENWKYFSYLYYSSA